MTPQEKLKEIGLYYLKAKSSMDLENQMNLIWLFGRVQQLEKAILSRMDTDSIDHKDCGCTLCAALETMP